MGLHAALGQLVVIAVILAACIVYTRYHVSSLERADFSDLEYFEDSKAGTGSRYRVLVRAADTSNASFTVEVLSRAGIPGFLPEKSASTPEHIHTQQQQEEVVVVQGRLGYLRGGNSTEGELGPGEKLVIPAGTQHALYNADNTTDLVYTLTHRPAGPMGEAFFENYAGLGWDYGSLDRLHPLQVLVIFDGSGTRLADLTGVMAPLIDKVLLPVSRFLGFKADYPSHRSKRVTSTRQQGQQQEEPESQAVRSSSSEHEEL